MSFFIWLSRYTFSLTKSDVNGRRSFLLNLLVLRVVRAMDEILSAHSASISSKNLDASLYPISSSFLKALPRFICAHFIKLWPKRRASPGFSKTKTFSLFWVFWQSVLVALTTLSNCLPHMMLVSWSHFGSRLILMRANWRILWEMLCLRLMPSFSYRILPKDSISSSFFRHP